MNESRKQKDYSFAKPLDFALVRGLRLMCLILSILFTQQICAQSRLNQQLDSIDNIVESDTFDDNYEPILNFLETIKEQGLNAQDIVTKARFLNYYAAGLYFCGKYKESIPYFKMYTKYVEEDGWGEQSCEYLSVYQSMGDAYYHLGELDEAESSIRHGMIYYENELDSCPGGYRCYQILADIAAAKHDSLLIDDLHHQAQQCFYNYINIENPSEYHKQLKSNFENLSQIVDDALALGDMGKYYQYRDYRANFLRNSGWYEEAEFEQKKLISDMLKSNYKSKDILQDAYLGLFITYNGENSVEKVKEGMPHATAYFSGQKDAQSNLAYSSILNQAAMTYEKSGDSLMAEKLYKQAISLCPVDSIKRFFCKNYAYMANRIGVNLLFENEPDNALVYFEKAKGLIDDKSFQYTLLHNIGRANMLKGNYKLALKYLNESAEMQKETQGKVMGKTLSYIKECKDKK